jgi:hypothetical protein
MSLLYILHEEQMDWLIARLTKLRVEHFGEKPETVEAPAHE